MKREGYDGVFLSLEDIIVLHDMIIDESEFNDDKGFIDGNGALFENAYFAIFASFGDIDFYPTIVEKACRLCYNIISSHVFANANKRTGLMVLLQMLDLNNITFTYTQDEMYDMVVGIASRTCDYEQLLEFVRARIIDHNSPGVKY